MFKVDEDHCTQHDKGKAVAYFSSQRLAAQARLVSILVLIAAIFITMIPSPARADSGASGHDTTQTVNLLNTAVDGESRSFDAQKARDLGVSAEDITDFGVGYAAGGGQVLNIEISQDEVNALAPAAVQLYSAAQCAGKNANDYTGAQSNLYMDSCATQKVIAALSTGASAAALAGVMASETGVGGVAGAIISGILSLGAGALGACAANGTGTIIRQIPPTGVIWCDAQ
ncbi:hypothetical protein JRG19_03475 [Pseudoclavibacter alba]|uniref:hypothetical protein n=1 Tax=Pseudoclavibacter albus TaxID=272241 RepID=UPI0019D19EFF|nr:hypothetical protein [Pseudoclavibacter alba]MBN6777612.1 hypothetical protein [Pseudoclavibacter alba]